MSEAAQQVGAYEVVRVIARGGMATVYEARQPALGRAVALKRLDVRTDDPTLLRRFIHESRLAASFDHPNIVTVFDFFESDGVPYIAMEYLPRGSLRPWVGGMSLPQVFGVLEGVLAGLSHAEQHGVAHRDLKPENVLVTGRGGVKIADFGIAKAYTGVSGRLTATGAAVGTPAYMAPEQALGGPVGPFTDLYALGAMAFEMLSGTTPFGDDETPVAILYRHVNDAPPALDAVRPGIEPRLAAWVAGLLEKAPEARPKDAAAAWQALEEVVVDMLGPYWRRHCALEEPAATVEARPAALTPVTAPTPATAPMTRRRPTAAAAERASGARRAPGRRSRRSAPLLLGAAAGIALVGALGALALSPAGSSSRRRSGTRTPKAAPPATAPFALAGRGRPPSVVAGVPGLAGGGGIVVLPSHRVIREPGRRRAGDQFGAAIASGDFNGDGRADLAIGAPGRNFGDRTQREGAVTVLYGGAHGVAGARATTISGPGGQLPYRSARFGAALVAGDLNRDGYSDLVVGAPGGDALPVEDRGSGTIEVLFGGRSGLSRTRIRLLRRPRVDEGRFGSVLALGDLNRDGNVDLVEGAPGDPRRSVLGHGSFCAGAPGGPPSCRPLGGPMLGGPASLAIGDVTGDGFPDVVEGVPDGGLARAGRPPAGELLLWRGTRLAPSARPLAITQQTRGVAGHDQAGDGFGAAVAVADLDRDGFADMVVGATGEDGGAGRVTVIRGGPSGHAAAEANFYEQRLPTPPTAAPSLARRQAPGLKEPGKRFGSSITLMDTNGDGRADLTVAVPGEANGSGALITMLGGPGEFVESGATMFRLSTLGPRTRLPRMPIIRLGRPASS